MGRIITFYGLDHKTGVSQTAQAAAESIAERYPYLKVLLIHTEGEGGEEYAPRIRQSVEDLKPYLLEQVLDGREAAEQAQYKGNLYIIGGDGSAGSAEGYMPEMAEYMLAVFAQDFDLVLCDSGSRIDHPLALGSLFCAARIYYVLAQSEVCLKRAERQLPLLGSLNLSEARLVVNRFDRASAFDAAYVSKRLEKDPAGFLTLRPSRRAADAEVEGRSLYSFKESPYRKDVDALAEDIVRTFHLAKEENEKKWLRKSSVSAKP